MVCWLFLLILYFVELSAARTARLSSLCKSTSLQTDTFCESLVDLAKFLHANLGIVSDDAQRARVMQLVSMITESGKRAIMVVVNSDGSDEAATLMREYAASVPLVASRLDAVLKELAQASANPLHSALSIGKAVATAMGELSKGHLASFQDGVVVPTGYSACLIALTDSARRISSELLKRGPSQELHTALMFLCNCIKHLAAGFVRGDTKKRGALIDAMKTWATCLVIAMKEHDDRGKCDEAALNSHTRAIDALVAFVSKELVERCAKCQQALSGNITIVDGQSFHEKCL